MNECIDERNSPQPIWVINEQCERFVTAQVFRKSSAKFQLDVSPAVIGPYIYILKLYDQSI